VYVVNFISSGSFVIAVNPKVQAVFFVSSVKVFDILQECYNNKFAYFLNNYYRLSFRHPEVRVGISAATQQIYVCVVLLFSQCRKLQTVALGWLP
jgi:hypothetical protein